MAIKIGDPGPFEWKPEEWGEPGGLPSAAFTPLLWEPTEEEKAARRQLLWWVRLAVAAHVAWGLTITTALVILLARG